MSRTRLTVSFFDFFDLFDLFDMVRDLTYLNADPQTKKASSRGLEEAF